VVTRGYGGSLRGVRLLRASDDAREMGDEPILISRRSGVPVAVGRDRPAAAQLLVAAGCDVILSDDGLQHHRLGRDCEIVVIDGERLFGNGRLLPAGPLREGRARLRGVDAVVVNGGAETLAGALRMRLEAADAVRLDGAQTRPLGRFAGQEVHAVAGIGHPERFFRLLRGCGIGVIEHALPDHAPISASDLDFHDSRPVLMTEKDAVKCPYAAAARHWYVPVSAHFEAGESTTLLDIVTDRIAERGSPRGTIDG
jgi:tetraacyldisaccharide 4'-kinase